MYMHVTWKTTRNRCWWCFSEPMSLIKKRLSTLQSRKLGDNFWSTNKAGDRETIRRLQSVRIYDQTRESGHVIGQNSQFWRPRGCSWLKKHSFGSVPKCNAVNVRFYWSLFSFFFSRPLRNSIIPCHKPPTQQRSNRPETYVLWLFFRNTVDKQLTRVDGKVFLLETYVRLVDCCLRKKKTETTSTSFLKSALGTKQFTNAVRNSTHDSGWKGKLVHEEESRVTAFEASLQRRARKKDTNPNFTTPIQGQNNRENVHWWSHYFCM